MSNPGQDYNIIDEIEELEAINKELVEACKLSLKYFDQINFRGKEARTLTNVIKKAEGRKHG